MSLRELQLALQNYILHNDASVKQLVVGTTGMVRTRLDIYAKAYMARLVEILRKQYPATEKLLGKRAFDKLASDYLVTHPSQHFSVRYLAQFLMNYLAQTQLDVEQPYVAELVRFETALADSIDAADATRLELSKLATVKPEDWSELRFQLHPSVISLVLDWNMPAIWQAYMNNKRRPKLIKQAQSVTWLVWLGTDLQSYFVALNDDLAAVIQAIQQGKTFADICQCLCDWHDEAQVAVIAIQHLQYLIQNSLLADNLA